MIDLKNTCEEVCKLTKITGQFIKAEAIKFKTEQVEVKGNNDFVSYVDKSSEQRLVEGLSRLLPEAGFIAEEGTSTKKGEVYNWIIDPLDGTTNFIHGLPCFSISIALMRNDELVLGVVYEINLDECFYAWENSDAYLNGKKIEVSKAKTLKNSLLATGFPYYDYGRMDEYLDLFKYFMQHTHGLRRLGSAATDLAYVACGRFEGFYEYSLQPWDVAAGAFIVQQAGGKVTDFKGGKKFIFGKELVASNGFISDEFLKAVQTYFDKK
ncbi:MAG TPA: inositol monophosphatase family protein [Bacteroidia bacterium]|jgi:myo-inositol-1(or 4)-monophosphatase|nr:inositol monophosphatase family protein [Bacteroidia bacterium]